MITRQNILKIVKHISFAILLLDCGNRIRILKLTDNINSNRQELIRYIPIHTEMNLARAKMEKAGFTCAILFNGQFLEHKNINYIYCDLQQAKGFLIAERWQIALVFKDNKITEIFSNYGLIGP